MRIWTKLQLALLNLLAFGKKGQGTLDSVIAIVVGAVALVIGLIIVSEIFSSTNWEADYCDKSTVALNKTCDAFNTTENMTFTAFGILPIVLLVMAAVAVIAAVLVLRGRRE